jgi:signal transduction histidine kinase/DNA-binding response OmpR family regulator
LTSRLTPAVRLYFPPKGVLVDDEPTNILVVDDLPEKLLAYRAILDELGQSLVAVGSGEEALRAVLRHDFAVILLDVNMPGMNGLETAAMIRRRKRSAHTPIIFLTAFADEVRAAEGYAQGAVDYITTPVVPAVLRAKVRVFCDLYRMTQQVKRQAEERIALAEERTKREAAEEANHRLRFLTRAGEVLGQSLDVSVTARDVARLPLPLLADTAALVTLQADGRPARFVRSRTTADGVVVEEGAAGEPADRELAAAVDRALAGAAAEPGPVVALPLRARGRTLAALGLSRSPSGRSFAPADLTVAEMFASRAASALENARLYHEVQQADRQKNEFLSMLAHELRNPLAPIRNATEVLRQKGSDPNRVRWAQGVIDRQLTHLVRLVDDLLDVSRLTLGKIRLSVAPLELEAVVAQAVEAVRPLVDQFRHELEVTLPAHPVRLVGDKARLTQVLTNLLNNAAKYTDPGGRIWLTVSAEVRGQKSEGSNESGPPPPTSEVEIRVRDTGVGIAADLLPTVFDLFTQANRSLDRSQGGLGVGLTLVKRLVEMHGGTVEATSEGPGKGSEFTVRLPAAPEAPVVAPAPAAEAAASLNGTTTAPPLRIVVVDDNVDGAETLANLLGLIGNQVRVAHDGPAGIDAVHGFRPDVVLLDIGLPGMDGYEVARRLRGEEGAPMLVAVSGYGRDEDRRMAREAGFEHHFVKPVDFVALRALLDSLRTTKRE